MSAGASITLAVRALRAWNPRQVLAAIVVAVVVAVIIGVATVLIPNPVFTREIDPVWWNYPVWLLTSAFSGVLAATYVDPGRNDAAGDSLPSDADEPRGSTTGERDREERRSSRMGLIGGVLAWFAVGCPVCNKLALLALGYSGAITWFTPVQPFLALGALILTGLAAVFRLRGQVACPVRRQPIEVPG